MLTLDERLLRILKELAKEPIKPILYPSEEGWLADFDDECVFCRGEQYFSRKEQRVRVRHAEGCIVQEAIDILEDHGR